MNEKEKQAARDKIDDDSETLELFPDEERGSKDKSASNRIIRAGKWLKDNYDFRFNVVTGETFVKRKEEKEFVYFDDRIYARIFSDIAMNANMSIAENHFRSLIYRDNLITKDYHPFREYLLNLPEWDQQTDHIKEFLKSVALKNEADRDYLIFGFKKWFVGLVVSMFVDELHRFFVNQTALILVSKEQGRKKSTWLQGLLPKQLQQRYYNEGSFDWRNKDHNIELARNVILNMEEMDAFNKNDVDAMKGKITQVMVKERPPFGRANLILKRRASFCGSTNNLEFLRDETGSRRWFVVEIEYMNYEPDYNVDLMYSQALALFHNDPATGQPFKYWFDLDEIRRLENENERFTRRSMEEELILGSFRPVDEDEIKDKGNDLDTLIRFYRPTDLANKLAGQYPRLNVNNSVVYNLGKALRKNGFIQTHRKVNGKISRFWAVAEILDKTARPVDSKGDEDDSPI